MIQPWECDLRAHSIRQGTRDSLRFFCDGQRRAPARHSLIDVLVNEKPIIVTEDNDLPKKGHRKGDEIPIAPLSSKIDWAKTKPRIAVEMRRIGFAPVGFSKWAGLMRRLRELALKVNPVTVSHP